MSGPPQPTGSLAVRGIPSGSGRWWAYSHSHTAQDRGSGQAGRPGPGCRCLGCWMVAQCPPQHGWVLQAALAGGRLSPGERRAAGIILSPLREPRHQPHPAGRAWLGCRSSNACLGSGLPCQPRLCPRMATPSTEGWALAGLARVLVLISRTLANDLPPASGTHLTSGHSTSCMADEAFQHPTMFMPLHVHYLLEESRGPGEDREEGGQADRWTGGR